MMEDINWEYRVYKNGSSEEILGAFVLRPNIDEAAWFAVMCYAHAIRKDNPTLSEALKRWLNLIDANRMASEMPVHASHKITYDSGRHYDTVIIDDCVNE